MQYSDRLQTIKECDLVDVVVQIYRGEKVNINAVTDDIKWLIEQAEKVERYEKEIKMLEGAVEQDQETKERYADEVGELISLNLWSARRLHKTHKKFVYDELEKITGQKHERL
jgi:hypothetical protein